MKLNSAFNSSILNFVFVIVFALQFVSGGFNNFCSLQSTAPAAVLKQRFDELRVDGVLHAQPPV